MSDNLRNSSDEIYIEYIAIDEIRRARRNPKEHDAGQIHESIRRFGYITPMLIDERTGLLVAGEGRLNELQGSKARGERVPDRIKVGDDGRWYAPVIKGVKFEDDDEAEAYLIADNRLTELGGWDESQLAAALSDLAAKGEEMLAGVGYDMDDIDAMWKRLHGNNGDTGNANATEDGEAGGDIGFNVAYGDVWRIGDNLVVVCGDSRDSGIWDLGLDALDAGAVDGIFTSPPYAEQRVREYGGVNEDGYGDWWELFQVYARVYLDDKASLFVNLKAHSREGERALYVMDLALRMQREWGWAFIDEFCWLRNPPPGKWPNRFKNGFEPVYHFAKTTDINFYPEQVRDYSSGDGDWVGKGSNVNMGNYYNTAGSSFSWEGSLPGNVVDIRENVTGVQHPAAFPVKLPRFFVEAFSKRGDIWCDPFAGSGSTLIACHQTNRKGLAIEKDELFTARMIRRLELETGFIGVKISA